MQTFLDSTKNQLPNYYEQIEQQNNFCNLLNNMLLEDKENMNFQQNTAKYKKSKTFPSDRFIPIRNQRSLDLGSIQLQNDQTQQYISGKEQVEDQMNSQSFSRLKDYAFSDKLQDSIQNQEQGRIMNFQQKLDQPYTYSDYIGNIYQRAIKTCDIKKAVRYIPQAPEKILDAPDIVDDYYLNLIDWGNTNNLAVSLGQSVYIWDANTSNIQQLLQLEESESYVTSVQWAEKGNYLAVGLSTNMIQLWDTEKLQRIRDLHGHEGRVSSLSWNNSILSSGGKDTCIINHDVRQQRAIICTYRKHNQEICGLKWSTDGTQLASGGNDNLLCIWGINTLQPRYVMQEHKAAVKALAWCPWQQNLLATGGGTADKTIKFWNTHTGKLLNSIHTESQVCGLIWNKFDKEIVSAHGFSKNQLSLWKYPTMSKIGELNGHTNRILNLAQSPDGSMIVSAAADETLRFWRIFDIPENDKYSNKLKYGINGINLRQL